MSVDGPSFRALVKMLLDRLPVPDDFKGSITLHMSPGRKTKPEVRWFPAEDNEE